VDLLFQESSLSISGGYVLTNLREVKENANGFRIRGTFEFIPNGSKVAQGFVHSFMIGTGYKF
jgi:hypothetical protein